MHASARSGLAMTLKAPRAAEYLASFLLGDATRIEKKTLSRRVGDAMVRSLGCFEAARSSELAPSQADWLELASFLAAASRRLPGHDLASTRLLLVRSIRSCARELSRPRFPRIPELPLELPVGRSRAAKALRSGASTREIFAGCVSCFHRPLRDLYAECSIAGGKLPLSSVNFGFVRATFRSRTRSHRRDVRVETRARDGRPERVIRAGECERLRVGNCAIGD